MKENLTSFIDMIKLTTQLAIFVFEWYLRSLKLSSPFSSVHCTDLNLSQLICIFTFVSGSLSIKLFVKSCITES